MIITLSALICLAKKLANGITSKGLKWSRKVTHKMNYQFVYSSNEGATLYLLVANCFKYSLKCWINFQVNTEIYVDLLSLLSINVSSVNFSDIK